MIEEDKLKALLMRVMGLEEGKLTSEGVADAVIRINDIHFSIKSRGLLVLHDCTRSYVSHAHRKSCHTWNGGGRSLRTEVVAS